MPNIFSNFFFSLKVQSSATAGHAVAYTIGPIFKHIIDCVQLYFTNSINCLRFVSDWRQRCQIAATKWPNDISSAADNAIFKSRAQNIENKCCQYPLLQFLLTIIVQHSSITIAIDCNGLTLFIFEEKWPKSATNSDSFWVRRLFNVCVRFFYALNATILLVYIPAEIEMSFIWKDDFFCQNRHLL